MNFLTVQRWYMERKHRLYTRLVRGGFGAMGKECTVQATMRCWNPRDIFLGDHVFIGADAWIDCFTEIAGQRYEPRLEIGDGTTIGYHSHIMCVGKMKIGKKVLIADKVYISDNLHSFEDVRTPIVDQPLSHKPVEIGDDVWLGENVCVLPGVTIGARSVIGSNSVVTRSIPSLSVAAGIPAKVIRRFNPDTGQWMRL